MRHHSDPVQRWRSILAWSEPGSLSLPASQEPVELHCLPWAGWRGPHGDRDFFLQGGSLALHRIRARGLRAFCLVTSE